MSEERKALYAFLGACKESGLSPDILLEEMALIAKATPVSASMIPVAQVEGLHAEMKRSSAALLSNGDKLAAHIRDCDAVELARLIANAQPAPPAALTAEKPVKEAAWSEVESRLMDDGRPMWQRNRTLGDS